MGLIHGYLSISQDPCSADCDRLDIVIRIGMHIAMDTRRSVDCDPGRTSWELDICKTGRMNEANWLFPFFGGECGAGYIIVCFVHICPIHSSLIQVQ